MALQHASDLKSICDFLGGTIFPEEYRTNLQELDKQIEELVQTITQSSSSAEQVSLLLLRAINHILRGELSLARTHLDSIKHLNTTGMSTDWQSRCSLYEFFLVQQQRSPPMLRFRADYDNPSATRKDIELSINRRTSELIQHIRSSRAAWRMLETLEGNLVLEISAYVRMLWGTAQPNHPNFPRNIYTDAKTKLSSMLFVSSEPYPESLLTSSEELGLGPVQRYLKRLAVEYSLSAGEAGALGMLSELYAECCMEQDSIGAAHCKLMEADVILSPPFTNSIALNLITLDQDLGWDNAGWDSTEAMFPLRRKESAEHCFEVAFQLFERSRSVRGQASVELRRACVDHAEAIAQRRSDDSLDPPSVLKSAEEHLSNSIRLFQGDSVNLQIVNTHRTLLLISQNSSEASNEAIEQARQIGEWAENMQYPAISQFAGMLMLRFGRMLLTPRCQVQAVEQHKKAVMCCKCARACFKSSKDPMLELHAVIAHARLHQHFGNLPLARALMTEGHELFPKMHRYINGLIEHAKEKEDCLRNMLADHTTNFDRAWSTIVGAGRFKFIQHEAEKESCPSILPAPATLTRFARLQTHLTRSLQRLEADYQETMESRRRALRVDADVRTADEILRQFCDRWDGEAANTVPQVTLCSMKLEIFHHLGQFGKARDTLKHVLPTQYGGRSTTADTMLQFDSATRGRFVAQRDLAERSLAQCFVAKDWQSGYSILAQMRDLCPGFPSDSPGPRNKDHWQLLVWIASIEEHCGSFEKAYDIYLQALHLFEQDRRQLYDLDSRRDLTSTIHSGQVFFGLAQIARIFSKKPDLAGHRAPQAMTWENQILIYLEQGRARALGDLLAVPDESAAYRIMLRLWNEYMYFMRSLQKALTSGTSAEGTNSIRNVGKELDIQEASVQKVRTELETQFFGLVPLMEGTPFASDMTSLFQFLPENAICIYLNISRDSMMTIAITSQGVQLVETLELTDVEIERTVLTFLKTFRKVSPHLGPPQMEPPHMETPQAETTTGLLKRISKWVIEPVVTLLKQKAHVIFIPSRSFHKFPFAAMIMEGRYLFLQKDVSQVPSLSALCHLIKKPRHRDGLSSAVIFNSDNESPLYLAGMEATLMSELHGFSAHASNSVSLKEFESIYESSDILHIATHGLQAGSSAWDSALSLGEKVRVVDIAKLQSRASLVCFAACVSGLGEDNIGNDMLGFSHAVIASGASAFIGGLWDVDNLATMILMIFFQRSLKEGEPGISLAACWRQAQIQLFELTKPKLKLLLEELLRTWDEASYNRGLPPGTSLQTRAVIQNFLIDDDECDFTHPFYWAPFILVGNGGLTLLNEDVRTNSVDY